MPKKSSQKPLMTPPIIQKLFITASILVVISQITQMLYGIAMQWPNNQNLSGYISWFVGTLLMFVVWGLLYLSRRHKQFSLQTLFEVTLATWCVTLVTVSISWLTYLVPPVFPIDNDVIGWYFAWYQTIPYLLVAPFVYLCIRHLRNNNQW